MSLFVLNWFKGGNNDCKNDCEFCSNYLRNKKKDWFLIEII